MGQSAISTVSAIIGGVVERAIIKNKVFESRLAWCPPALGSKKGRPALSAKCCLLYTPLLLRCR